MTAIHRPGSEGPATVLPMATRWRGALGSTDGSRGGFEPGSVHMMVRFLIAFFLLGCSTGDFVNAKTLFDLEFPSSSASMAWILAVTMSMLAVVAMHLAGYVWREARLRPGLRHLAVAVVAGWAALGTMLCVLRVRLGSPAAHAVSSANPLAGLSGGRAGFAHPVALALVLGAVWGVVGVVSFGFGYLLHDPFAARFKRMEQERRRKSRAVSAAAAACAQAGHTLAAQQLHRARLPWGYQAAVEAAGGRRDELKQIARLDLAQTLGDPAATTDIFPRAGK